MKINSKRNAEKVIPLRKKKRRIFWTKPRILILMVAALVLCVLFLPIFQFNTFVVTGNKNLQREQIMDKASVAAGTNLFRINLKRVKDNIKRLPYVEEVEVHRKLPDQISIEVKERTPMYQVAFNGVFLILSEKNEVLEIVSKMRAGIPQLKGLVFQNFKLGQPIPVADILTSQASRITIEQIQAFELLKRTTSVDVTNPNHIWMCLDDVVKIDIGNMTEVNYKFTFLKKILEEVPKGQKGTITVNQNGRAMFNAD
ncbi:MAG: FtsQ-type POTRA domain-containing protein [Hyphomonadaceae bacterium]|nr:FtsQ-type POTRA domain-containing protein [Clostridia bacterium]